MQHIHALLAGGSGGGGSEWGGGRPKRSGILAGRPAGVTPTYARPISPIRTAAMAFSNYINDSVLSRPAFVLDLTSLLYFLWCGIVTSYMPTSH